METLFVVILFVILFFVGCLIMTVITTAHLIEDIILIESLPDVENNISDGQINIYRKDYCSNCILYNHECDICTSKEHNGEISDKTIYYCLKNLSYKSK